MNGRSLLPSPGTPHAPDLTEVPKDMPPGPHREAVELANEATFTQTELEAYRKVRDEIQQAREYGDAKRAEGFAEGETAGFTKGETAGKVTALLAFLAARGLTVSEEVRARIEACKDAETLNQWIARAVTATSADEVVASTPPDRS